MTKGSRRCQITDTDRIDNENYGIDDSHWYNDDANKLMKSVKG